MPFNKSLVAKDFSKSASRYPKSADLQLRIAGNLLDYSQDFIKGAMLDIGAGTGFLRNIIDNRATIYEMDISLGMLNQCSKRNELLINCDMDSLCIKPESFDAVISSSTLHWSNNLPQLFTEINSSIKPKGHFIFAVFGEKTLSEIRERFESLSLAEKLNSFPRLPFIKESLENSGFEITKSKTESFLVKYENAKDLLKKIKGIGGHSKSSGNPLTKSKLALIEQNFSGTATWEVYYFICKKP